MTHKTKTPLALAIGTAFVASLAASGIAYAAPNSSNPFAMSELNSGYMQVADSHMQEGNAAATRPPRKASAAKVNAAAPKKKAWKVNVVATKAPRKASAAKVNAAAPKKKAWKASAAAISKPA